MGSPASERGHRPDEAQADGILTTGFWTAKHEVTQGQWRRVIGACPDRLPSAALGQGDEFPVYWIYHTRLPGGTDPDLYQSKGVPNRDGTYSRVRRGGAWIEDGSFCRSACRLRYEPHRRSDHIGFRVVAVER